MNSAAALPITVDTHVDTILRMVDLGEDLSVRSTNGYMDLPTMREGGLGAAFFACCVSFDHVAKGTAGRRALELIDAVHALSALNPSEIRIATTSGGVRKLIAEGRHAAVIAVEGAHPLEGDLGALARWCERGVRLIGLTHFNSNDVGDSATDVPRHGGLSQFGRQVVAEANRLGIMIDLSHASDAAFWQALELSRQPLIASHSSARALVDHPRNLTDEMIKALASQGGLIGVTCWPEYISDAYCRALERYCAATAPKGGGPLTGSSAIAELLARIGDDPLKAYNVLIETGVPFPTLSDYLDHVDHVVGIAGVDHIALGTDHGACRFDLVGLESCAKLPALTEALRARGFSQSDAGKILGGNVLRYMEAVTGS